MCPPWEFAGTTQVGVFGERAHLEHVDVVGAVSHNHEGAGVQAQRLAEVERSVALARCLWQHVDHVVLASLCQDVTITEIHQGMGNRYVEALYLLPDTCLILLGNRGRTAHVLHGGGKQW